MMDQRRQIIETRFNRIVVVFFCLLIYFLPISIALTESMAGFVIFFFLLKKILLATHDLRQLASSGRQLSWMDRLKFFSGGLTLPDSKLNKPMGVFILVVMMSSLHSQFFMISFIAFFAKLMEGYFLYLSFAECVKTKKHVRNFIVVYFISVLLMGINGIVQNMTGTEFVRGTPLVDGRVSSSLRHANDFGAYLIFVLPLLLGFMMMPLNRMSWVQEWKANGALGGSLASKAMIVVLFLLAVVCLGFTYSRGSWVAFLFSLCVLVFLRKRGYLWIAGVGLAFMIIFMPFLVQIRDVSFVSDNVKVQQDVDMQNKPKSSQEGNPIERFLIDRFQHHGFSGMGRSAFWSEAIGIIKRYPFLGSGLNTYARMGTKYGYAHNCYLQMAAEIGLLGLASFLVMMGIFFYVAFKALQGTVDPFLHAALIGAMSGLVGFLVQSSLDTSFYSVQLGNLMWVFMGLIVAVYRLSKAGNN